MTMGFKIINTNALGQLYTNKYNDLKDAHFSEKGLKLLDMKDDFQFNKSLDKNNLLTNKIFQNDFSYDESKDSWNDYLIEISKFFNNIGGQDKFPFISFYENSFIVKKKFEVSFGYYSKKLFGGQEYIPHETINLKDINLSYSYLRENNSHLLMLNQSFNSAMNNFSKDYENNDFKLFLIYVTNIFCNLLAENLYILDNFEKTEWGFYSHRSAYNSSFSY